MTITYGPFDAGAGASVSEDFWSRMARMWKPDGVVFNYLNECEVYGDSSGRQVKVKSGGFYIKGHYAYDTAETTLALTTNVSGNPRIDVITAEIDWVNNTMEFAVVEGTPGATPVAPSLTQTDGTKWQIKLAEVAIANGYTTVAAGDVTDYRQYTQCGRLNLTGFTPPTTGGGDDAVTFSGEGLVTYKNSSMSKGDLLSSVNLFKMPPKYNGGNILAKVLVEPALNVIDSCDAAWTAGSNVTDANEGTIKKEGLYSRKLTVSASATAGQIIAYKNFSSKDLSGALYVYCWFRTDTALADGDWQLMLDDTNGIASPVKTYNIPACLANTWYFLEWAAGDMSGMGAALSVGLYQVVDKGAMIAYIDEIGVTGQVIMGVSSYMMPSGPGVTPININDSAIVYGTPQYSALTTLRYHRPVEIKIPTKITPAGTLNGESYASFSVVRKNDATDKHGAEIKLISAIVLYPESF